MLKATSIKGAGVAAASIEGTLVLVSDHLGNPLVVVHEVQPGMATVVAADDPDFNRILSAIGLDKVTVCDKLLLQNKGSTDGQLIMSPEGGLLL